MVEPLTETCCPLCGGDNGCAPAASGTFETPCWCMTADFPPELLERIAAADRGRSCLCARCAAGATGARAMSPEDGPTEGDPHAMSATTIEVSGPGRDERRDHRSEAGR